MPRHTSALRPAIRPQDARHDHATAKVRRAQRLASKHARKSARKSTV